MPQYVEFEGRRFCEYVDLQPQQFLEKLKGSTQIPVSAPASVEEFIQAFFPIVQSGESILYLAPSSVVSKIYQIVQQAAAHFPGADIRVIDTRMIASANATLALRAAEWAAERQSGREVEMRVRRLLACGQTFFLVPGLDFLARSGRIGGAAALVGDFLQLKPILTFREGQVDRYEMVRTQRHALVRLQEVIIQQARVDVQLHLNVMHAGMPEEGQALAKELRWKLDLSKVPVYDISPSVVCSAGPGTLGLSFYLEPG